MATTTRGAAVASPQIFTSDPLEQIFARGMEGPNGGLLYGLMAAARLRREAEQEQYLGALDKSNSVAAMIQQLQMAADMKKESMKQAGDLIAKGYLPSSTQEGGSIFSDLGSGDAMAKLLQTAIQAKINHDNASAAAAGQSGKDQVTVRSTGFPGTESLVDISGKGRNPQTVIDLVNAARAAQSKVAGGTPLSSVQRAQIEALRNQPQVFGP